MPTRFVSEGTAEAKAGAGEGFWQAVRFDPATFAALDMAGRHTESGSGYVEADRRALDTIRQNPAPLAAATLPRPTPKVGAECVGSARSDLSGGRGVTRVLTGMGGNRSTSRRCEVGFGCVQPEPTPRHRGEDPPQSSRGTRVPRAAVIQRISCRIVRRSSGTPSGSWAHSGLDRRAGQQRAGPGGPASQHPVLRHRAGLDAGGGVFRHRLGQGRPAAWVPDSAGPLPATRRSAGRQPAGSDHPPGPHPFGARRASASTTRAKSSARSVCPAARRHSTRTSARVVEGRISMMSLWSVTHRIRRRPPAQWRTETTRPHQRGRHCCPDARLPDDLDTSPPVRSPTSALR